MLIGSAAKRYEPDGRSQHAVIGTSECKGARGLERVVQLRRWYPKGRKIQAVVWLVYALVSVPAGVLWLTGDGRRWMGVMYLMMAVLGGLLAWNAIRRRVEADGRGLRVIDSWRARAIAWEDIDEIRPDAQGPWATRLVVVTRDGEVVKLPLEPTELESVKRSNP